jgi:hypothetical protein
MIWRMPVAIPSGNGPSAREKIGNRQQSRLEGVVRFSGGIVSPAPSAGKVTFGGEMHCGMRDLSTEEVRSCPKCGARDRSPSGYCRPCNAKATKAYRARKRKDPLTTPCRKCGVIDRYPDGRCANCHRPKMKTRSALRPKKLCEVCCTSNRAVNGVCLTCPPATSLPCTRCGTFDRYADGTCKVCKRASSKRFMEKDPEHYSKLARESKFGMPRGGFDYMWNSQKGRCKSCGCKFLKTSEAHVDHDHETGDVRGLLCGGCNCAAGFLKDSANLCRKLAKYLDSKHRPFAGFKKPPSKRRPK